MLRFRALRLHRIDQNEKWLVQAFQLANHAILRVQIRFARKIRYGTVGCHDKANGGVVGNDLSRAQLGSLRHGNGSVAPWCRDHARRVLLRLPECAVNEITDAVHQSNLACPIIVQRNFCGFFRHKFRLRGHDGSAGTRLRQFILGAFASIHVVNTGQDQRFHKSLDKGGFSGSNRPDDADINGAAGTAADIFV